MQTFSLNARFQTWWHIGTGRGSGQHLDAICDKTADGLPYVSAKSLKGLFRHSAHCLETWGRLPIGTTAELFGVPPEGGQPGSPGVLRFTDLTLDEATCHALNEQPELKSFLFSEIASTAIDPETGGARDKTLRVREVTVPLELSGQITWLQPEPKMDQLPEWLAQMAILITHIGADKSRGFGEVILKVQPEESAP